VISFPMNGFGRSHNSVDIRAINVQVGAINNGERRSSRRSRRCPSPRRALVTLGLVGLAVRRRRAQP